MVFSTQLRLALAFSAAAAVSVSGCGKDPEDGADYAVVEGEPTSCIQGVVTDALTGARIDITNSRIYLVFGNRVFDTANKVKESASVTAAHKAEVEGEYSLCGIPNSGISLPLYISLDGYQQRIYNVAISGATPTRNATTSQPGFWVTPTVLQNVQLYKKADLIQKDFVVNVNMRGAAIADASVWLEPTNVAGMTIAPLTGTTDASGNATFSAANLAFGASYDVTIVPKTPLMTDGSYVNPMTTATYTMGTIPTTSAAAGLTAIDPFTLRYDLGAATAYASSAPVLVTSTPTNTVNTAGTVTLVFDRDVRVDQVTNLVASGTTVAISSYGTKVDGTACVAADIGTPVADATKNVTVTISGRIVTLTPVWTTAPTNTATCGGASIAYTLNSLRFYATNATVPTQNSALAGVTIQLSARL